MKAALSAKGPATKMLAGVKGGSSGINGNGSGWDIRDLGLGQERSALLELYTNRPGKGSALQDSTYQSALMGDRRSKAYEPSS
jgi:hypothetical protein